MRKGRNNPLTLHAVRVGDGFGFLARLTPNGDDEVCRSQTEIDPTPTPERCEAFDAFHAALLSWVR
ncbi:hypothetical protein [Streptomyces sp. NBC_00448]|uniref:hypothetical protein n=1 Tax=Streptomyces sp. NBC_00448 TaxID=2903652 RepID=UPI002E22D828